MRRSIATICLSGGLEEKLSAAAAAKFDAVELSENDLIFFDGAVGDARALAADLGLSILAFHPLWNFEATPSAQFRKKLALAARKLDIVSELGAKLMLLNANAGTDAQDNDDLAADQLGQLAELAASRGVKIGYEAHAGGRHVQTYAKAWGIVRAAAHSHLGLVLNSFQSLALKEDLSGISHIPGEKIFLMHLADAPRVGVDVVSHEGRIQCFPGQGELDVVGFVAQAIEAGYTGPLSLEVTNDQFRASAATAVARDAMRSLLFLEERIRLRPSASANDRLRAGAQRVPLFDPPPCPPLTGIAFIEFAVSRGDNDLSEFLEALGFIKTGLHRNKNVTLYQQGDIAIALNAEKDSFASSYNLVHGQSVCAVGLSTKDPAALLSRAEAFGSATFEERVGHAESPMAGIRSPDGSLFYAVEDNFDPAADFSREPSKTTSAHPPLRRIDHIGQALPEGRLETWLLFYRALFDLSPQEPWAILDPYGSVKSRALSNATKTVRFPMTYSQGARTMVARSLHTFFGAGVNQIAFETGDIFRAAQVLRERGVPLLSIPANYYDDLAARYDLPEDFSQTLRDAHVLYDRDEKGGEFFHFYTQTFKDRFFFEVLQRKGGYDQYGAANAAVRIAAQSRALDGLQGLELD